MLQDSSKKLDSPPDSLPITCRKSVEIRCNRKEHSQMYIQNEIFFIFPTGLKNK